MIEDGLFEGLDAALMYHPCDRNHVESWPLASEDVDVVFHGIELHASSDAWKGGNALDALIVLFNSVGLWRQQPPRHLARPRDHPRGRHGRERHPGPDLGLVHDPRRGRGLLRDDARPTSASLCEAAALATGTTVEVTFSGKAMTMRNNPVLVERFRANMAAYGIDDQGDDPNAGSTDMANVSWVCPTIHPELSIAPEGTPGHSIEFRDAAVTPTRRRGDPPGRHPRRPDRVRAVRGPGAPGRGVARLPRDLTRRRAGRGVG